MEPNLPKLNILLGLSGSVATIKYLELLQAIISQLPAYNVQFKVVVTKNSLYFLQEEHQKTLKILISDKEIPILVDENEWTWKSKGDAILHIDLRKWADIFLIAPLSANTLAKISNGLCDNLLTSVARAWDFTRTERKINVDYHECWILKKPFIVAPAMNTFMYEHPLTKKQIKTLRKLDIIVLHTVRKLLPCGDEGFGAMCHVRSITEMLEKLIKCFI